MKLIDAGLIATLKHEARINPRKRKIYRFHEADADPLQRMVNFLYRDSYVRPHKHENPDKREAFIVLSGSLLVVEFDAGGYIQGHTVLDPDAGCYGAEVPPRTWHTLIPLSDEVLVYEVKDGPYDPQDDKDFAPWAPEEGSAAAKTYVRHILQALGC